MQQDNAQYVVIGKIAGVYGVKGWLKIYSFTEPLHNIFNYAPWLIRVDGEWREVGVAEGRPHGKGLVAQLEGCDDREDARTFVGCEIAALREQFAEAEPGEYYWTDLIGLQVLNQDGVDLGRIDHLFETGSNDVIVVKGAREHLLPYLPGQVIQEIDLAARVMRVDWDPEF
ncbi:MAG: ribosome maturation factor RimM [Gammaproteobacteria bacterium]|nr:ribosome maturation factor RimM [Gammaproteobacteria bacterium]